MREWFTNEQIEEIRKKLIPKEDTIIIFDEAHFSQTAYQELIRQTIQLGYKVVCMSATFKGKDFSLTSSYRISSRLVSGFESEKVVVNGKKIEKLSQEKTFVFLKNLELHEEQKKILKDNNICYVVLDKAYEPAAEGISEGAPPGAVLFGTDVFEMGYTFAIQNTISNGKVEENKLGVGWSYTKEEHEFSLPSGIQQRGRVGRTEDGTWYTLSKDFFEDTGVSKDYAASIIKATLSKDTSGLSKDLQNWMYLAGGISLPDKFGLPPEAILIGIYGSPNGPKFPNDDKKKPSGCDENLWYLHKNKVEKPVEMTNDELVQAKEILKLMVDTFLNQQKDFPYRIKVEIENPLIEKTNLKVEEVRPILNNFIENKLTEL